MPESVQYDIRLKLLSANNVIVAKCEGLETEVFMPALIEGRINLINVIPQRRCNCYTTTHLVGRKAQPNNQAQLSPSDTLTKWRVPTTIQKTVATAVGTPLANSTPAPHRVFFTNVNGNSSNQDAIPSPEPMRQALAELETSFAEPMPINRKKVEITNVQIIPPPQSANNVEKTLPKPRSHQAPGSPTSSRTDIRNNFENQLPAYNSFDMDLPRTPVNSVNATFDLSNVDLSNNIVWRKVLTPRRTYARRKHPLSATSTRPVCGDVTNHYLRYATDGDPGSYSVVWKKRKLIIDKKRSISPHSLKEQLNTAPATSQKEKFLTDLRKLSSEKITFGLLTSMSSTSKGISNNLKELFRSRCVNKASSTYPKYKKLCNLMEESYLKSNTQNCAIINPPTVSRINQIQANSQTSLLRSSSQMQSLPSINQFQASAQLAPSTSTSSQMIPIRAPSSFYRSSTPTATINVKKGPRNLFPNTH